MKVCIVQPEYSTDYSRADELFEKQLAFFHRCDPSMDIIVFPESCDIPCLAPSKEAAEACVVKFNKPLLETAAATAKRCSAMVFVNARCQVEGGLRNTTYAFDRQGNLAGTYFKQHLTPGELKSLDYGYSHEFSQPFVMEMEGLRFGFMTCYDFYFYENFSNLARQGLDIIIGCSHQRSDPHSATEVNTRFLAYNTNTYVLRSSVSMDVNSDIGGCSMVAAPDGQVLCNLYSRVDMACVEIDPGKKYCKPAGFGNPDAPHYAYAEEGRRPWKYRPAGSAIAQYDSIMPYPRLCAHRGFGGPENSLASLATAVALGAQEIEFDIWVTKDGELVACHDANLERLSNGTGKIYEHTYQELLELDFGIKHDPGYTGLRLPTFEEVLQKLACHAVMNIHIKTPKNAVEYPREAMAKLIALIDKYDCRKHVYFMSGNDAVLALAQEMAPDICRCVGAGTEPSDMVARALRYNCKKIQLFKGKSDMSQIEQAHANGLICNLYWSDDPEEAQKYLDMGIHTILTNQYQRLSHLIKT